MNIALRIIIFLAAALPTLAIAAEAPPRVLLIVANGTSTGSPKNGFDLNELAQALEIFEKNGFEADIASPGGGKANASDYEASTPSAAALLTNRPVMESLDHSLSINELEPSSYDALFLIGGSGAMFDFPSHEGLQRFLAAAWEHGLVIGGVCHGPAALVNVRLGNGRYLIDGRTVSAFTEEEEAVFGSEAAKEYPFVLERALRERNAKFVEAPVMLVQVSRDGRLVTGQNPFSTPRSAEEVVRALGRTPAQREPYREEATIELIAQLLDAETRAVAEQALVNGPEKFDARLISAYGASLFKTSADEAEIQRARSLVELGGRYFPHPRVRLTLARIHMKLGDHEEARAVLEKAAAEFPDSEPIAALLKEIPRGSNHDDGEIPPAADRRPE